jgi:hypothetical protein
VEVSGSIGSAGGGTADRGGMSVVVLE